MVTADHITLMLLSLLILFSLYSFFLIFFPSFSFPFFLILRHPFLSHLRFLIFRVKALIILRELWLISSDCHVTWVDVVNERLIFVRMTMRCRQEEEHKTITILLVYFGSHKARQNIHSNIFKTKNRVQGLKLSSKCSIPEISLMFHHSRLRFRKWIPFSGTQDRISGYEFGISALKVAFLEMNSVFRQPKMCSCLWIWCSGTQQCVYGNEFYFPALKTTFPEENLMFRASGIDFIPNQHGL